MTTATATDALDCSALPPPWLPTSITTMFSSMKCSGGHLCVPSGLQLKATFGELKLDLRDAVFPYPHVLLVAESLCASVEVLLPRGVSVVNDSVALLSSHKVDQAPDRIGPMIHLEGWSVCSDVKFVTETDQRTAA
jgi:hypothetical protein